MNRTAHGFVLLEDDDVEAALAEQAGGVQAGRAGSDDDDVVHPDEVWLGLRVAVNQSGLELAPIRFPRATQRYPE